MDAVLSINNNAQYIVFPFWPDETEITAGAGNTTYNGLSFNIRMAGIEELKTLEISSFFPARKYPFVSAYANIDPEENKNFILGIMQQKIPARLVLTDSMQKEVLNIAVTVDSFNYSYRKNGDIDYSLSLTEYVFIKG